MYIEHENSAVLVMTFSYTVVLPRLANNFNFRCYSYHSVILSNQIK